ncbi:hypothetical protein Vafri_5549 [Volvox africanus]|uniref:Uncharacterized protein n=1 Tax=Volvox africanus TaxID=51714 RepID=A0A8J4AWM5_9CHLO|nr:hypothetical protein Vafri_5549 [Volvox africanus]
MEACPVCGSPIPGHLLESHVNQHFDEPPNGPPNANSRREPDILTARCTICGASVPLTQLDAHERGHESRLSAPPRRRRGEWQRRRRQRPCRCSTWTCCRCIAAVTPHLLFLRRRHVDVRGQHPR